jgi:hypothetical protein
MTSRSRTRPAPPPTPRRSRRRQIAFVLASLVTGILALILVLSATTKEGKDAPLAWFYVVPSLVLFGASLWFLADAQATPPANSSDTEESRRLRRAWGLAVVGMILMVPVCVALRVFGKPPVYEWTRFPYLDKRWLVLTYWSGTFGFLVLPLVIRWFLRFRERRRESAASWVDALRALDPTEDRADEVSAPRGIPRHPVLPVLLGLLLATVMGGPPWNTIVPLKGVDGHESIHWTGLQAISHGHTPYLGPASVNYGPGAQVAIYAYMKLRGLFTIPGFREANSFLLWIALLLVSGMVFWQLRLGPAFLALFLMIFISPLMLYQWAPMGYLYGFSGWAIPIRFIGALVLALGVCATVRRGPSPRSIRIGYLGLGLLWGLLSYTSQESFFGGIFTIGILTVLLYLTGTIGLAKLAAAAQGFLAGAIAFYTPICLYYLAHGGLFEFWRNYFLVPLRFGRGYANTPWWVPFGAERIETESLSFDPLTVAYYTLPYLVIGVALLGLYRTRRLRVAALDSDRVILVAAAVAFLSAYSGTLLRSDDFHLVGTLFAVPVVIAAALFYLPSFHCRTRLGRWTVRVFVLLLTAVVFQPIWKGAPERLLASGRGRLHSYTLHIPPYAEEFARDDIERRYGPSLIELKRVQRILPAFRKVKSIVGDRPTLVLIESPGALGEPATVLNSGELNFCADLNVGPYWLERTDMVANSVQLKKFVDHFRTHVDRFDFVISDVPEGPEIDVFRAAFPDGPHWDVSLGVPGRSLYVFGRTGVGG